MASLLDVQYITARLRRSPDRFEAIVQNSPIMLIRDGEILPAALDATRVAEDDLIAKLLHDPKVQERLLESVQRLD